MNAAQIQHQHIIYEDPNVIVTGELEDHGLPAGGAHVELAVFRLRELHRHGHAQVVVRKHFITGVCFVFRAGENIGRVSILVRSLNAIEKVFRPVKREEVAQAHVAIECICVRIISCVRAPYGGAVVQRKGAVAWHAVLGRGSVSIRIKLREVLPGVVVIVAFFIHLEQAGDVFIGHFAIRFCFRIKQIPQRCLFAIARDHASRFIHCQPTALQKLHRERSSLIHTGVFMFRMI